nr:MAG TPA: tail-collar fiber protein [Caudoviricetes sp.]
MAKYPAVITTMAGTNTIAEANASKQALIFTKIVIGAGDMPASIPRATALTDKRLELAITKSVKTGDGQFMVQGLLSNKNLEAGFYAREIGLMAKAGENGQEVLFSYTNGGNYVDYIPDKNTPMDSYTFTITTVVGNAEKVQAIISDNGVASVHDLEAHNMDPGAHGGLLQNLKNQLSTHNTDISSHPAITDAIAKILGATDWQENPVATLKDIKTKLGEGGIVAQRFGESGFVKYANGFTIQWGQFKENQTSVSYLISYIEIFGTVTMMKDEPKRLYEASVRANNITTTGFELHSGYVGNHIAKAINNGFWINIGRS